MSDKILFVDDEVNVLAGYQRQLRKLFKVDTASNGSEGLKKVAEQGPYSVIVSDFRMPVMDGVQFLSRAKEIAPDSVRMMLTGYADIDTAIEAVNAGNIFRLLTKPCTPEGLVDAINAGVRQYRLIHAERDLLEKTLHGSIRVLTEVLALLNPEAFGRASRISRYVKEVAVELRVEDSWQLETAAMLSQIGCITLPEETLRKLYQGKQLSDDERQLFVTHPSVASDLIRKIPRMEEIAEVVAYQEKHFDGSGSPDNGLKAEAIPLGARILKVVLDFDLLEAAGIEKTEALRQLRARPGWYDPAILQALDRVIKIERGYESRSITLAELKEGMLMAEELRSLDGRLLIGRGHTVTQPLIERLKNVAQRSGIKEPFQVFVPVACKQKDG
ncbi:MAG: response regulator [Deltaproteobacteria bacterium]|nr:response regulator [Deltaproteobacteria bacterium]MBW2072415.1 response regulator [Deltaproteobacteria bacterium]